MGLKVNRVVGWIRINSLCHFYPLCIYFPLLSMFFKNFKTWQIQINPLLSCVFLTFTPLICYWDHLQRLSLQFLRMIFQNIGNAGAYNAKLCAFMYVVEKPKDLDWSNLLIKTNSQLVVSAFKQVKTVPWSLRNHWSNCFRIARDLNRSCSHIFREGNTAFHEKKKKRRQCCS